MGKFCLKKSYQFGVLHSFKTNYTPSHIGQQINNTDEKLMILVSKKAFKILNYR